MSANVTINTATNVEVVQAKEARRGEEVTAPTLALTREGAAKALNLSPATVDRLTKRGLLKPSRATRRPLYSVASLQQFLATTSEVIEP